MKIRGSDIFQPQMIRGSDIFLFATTIRGSDNFNREIFLPKNKKAKWSKGFSHDHSAWMFLLFPFAKDAE